MNVKTFRDLKIWQEAHELTKEIYKITANFPKEETFNLVNQLRRAATSIPANIAEGIARNTTKEFLSFLFNARGSCSEVLYLLLLTFELNYFKKDEFRTIENRYFGLLKGITVFISRLKNH
ncbi:four helix bundle protein [Candidatus Gribaldobacteria bacterium]|nr:four helix bundle protein [Candidatus Gribaldobacteria bacterium]